MLGAAALVTAPLCALAAWSGRLAVATGLAWGACLVYLGVVKIMGLTLAPWVALALALAAAVATRRRGVPAGPLVLLTVIGSIAAAYLALSLERYLGGAPADLVAGRTLQLRRRRRNKQ
jgi:hypothetical protein